MLEVTSHNKLKSLLKEFPSTLENLTLSRLIGRSLRKKEKTLIQLDVNTQNIWWPSLLIPLYLVKGEKVLALSNEQREHLIKIEIPRLKKYGFNIKLWEEKYPPIKGKLWVLNYNEILDLFYKKNLNSTQIIFPGAENLNYNLRKEISLQFSPSDWEDFININPNQKQEIIRFYNYMSKKLFSESSCINGNVRIDKSEINSLKKIIHISEENNTIWNSLMNLNSDECATWAELNHKSLQWNWHIQPLDPINKLVPLINEIPCLFITQTNVKNDSFLSKLNKLSRKNYTQINLNKNTSQKIISVFAPKYQPLPNSKIYEKYILQQLKRLLIGITGPTIVQIDDKSLLIRITTELAGELGKRVTYEKSISEPNAIICCSSSWWLNNHDQIHRPKQLIIGVLPIASLSSPLTASRVEAHKKKGLDWFRKLLLPEALNIFERSIVPIRQNNGRVAILDGRLRSRSWGKEFLEILRPMAELHRLLP